MANLYLRGQHEPIEITQEEAKEIKEALDSNQRGDTICPLEFKSYRLSEIKGVELEKPRQERNSIDENDQKYFREREERVQWFPKEKAGECLTFFSLYFYAKTMREPTEEENHWALEIMEKYFEEHKDRIFPPITLFKIAEETKKEENKFESDLRIGIIRMFENIENQERYMVERDKNKAF